MKNGLVLEGGAMRGLFTAGVIDVMMEAGIGFDGIIGVSAGAAFGCNYKSHQPGRVLRYNVHEARNPRFAGIASLLVTGNYYNAAYGYHYLPDHLDVIDRRTFAADPAVFYVVTTDVETGEAVYHEIREMDYDGAEWVRASASMPLCSRIVEVDGHKMLDGGVSDSIPLQRFEQMGYGRNVVVLTQPSGYRKGRNRWMPLMRVALWRYPRFIRAMGRRHLMYNEQLDYVHERELAGKALVLRPPHNIPIGHLSHDPEAMKRAYDMGTMTARERLEEIKTFLQP